MECLEGEGDVIYKIVQGPQTICANTSASTTSGPAPDIGRVIMYIVGSGQWICVLKPLSVLPVPVHREDLGGGRVVA